MKLTRHKIALVPARLKRSCLAVVALGLATAIVANSPTALAGDTRDVEVVLELPQEKADAVFKLLAPNTVKVLVGRRAKGVHVRGTAEEVSTLNALAELMMRESGREISDPGAFVRELRAGWDSQAIYELPEQAGAALLTVLAFDDVPVLVSVAPTGIGVEARKQDQAVIADIARIQQGVAPKMLHQGKPQKIARSDHGNDPPGRRRGARGRDGDRRRGGRDGGRNPGAMRRGRGLSEKVDRLEERIVKLEALADALHSGEGHHPEGHHDGARGHGDRDHHRKSGDHGIKHDKKKKKQERHAKKNKKSKHNQNELITLRYTLPTNHAKHLYDLFAPDDVTDVFVSRSGKSVEIRATRKQQRTIKQLVKMLSSDVKVEPVGGRGKKQTG